MTAQPDVQQNGDLKMDRKLTRKYYFSSRTYWNENTKSYENAAKRGRELRGVTASCSASCAAVSLCCERAARSRHCGRPRASDGFRVRPSLDRGKCVALDARGSATETRGAASATAVLRSELKKWIDSPPNFERLVLSCIETDVCQ